MKNPTSSAIFLSYSRTDKDFALSLAALSWTGRAAPKANRVLYNGRNCLGGRAFTLGNGGILSLGSEDFSVIPAP